MHISQLLILRMLPLIALVSPLAALATDADPVLPMTVGKTYTGTLTPSPSNPNGEVCYQLAVKPNTRITMDVKTDGVGILKFSVYNKAKALRFFHNHNDMSNRSSVDGDSPTAERFSFPIVGEASQLCLTTTNPGNGQKYDLTVTGKPRIRSRSRVALRPVVVNNLTAPAHSGHKPPPAPTSNKPPTSKSSTPPIDIPPPPIGEPYCYVGIWQMGDLNGYWLPAIQSFTQAKITDPQAIGYAKLTIEKNGNASFEAFELEQRYTLRVKETGARIDRIGVGLAGSASARFQANSDSTLTFNSQNYQRLSSKLNLGANWKLTGERGFMLFGDRDAQPIKLPYKCLDRDSLILKIPAPTGQKLIPISLKRIS